MANILYHVVSGNWITNDTNEWVDAFLPIGSKETNASFKEELDELQADTKAAQVKRSS